MRDDLFRLTEDEFFQYIRCPLHYDSVYRKRFSPACEPTMNTLLGKAAASFYSNLMNGTVMTTGQLKQKWDRICEENADYVTPQRCLDGIALIMKLYRWAAEVELRIADRSVPYVVGIKGSHGTTEFSGHIDTVAIDRDNSFYLLVTEFGSRYPSQSILDTKLKLSMDSYAFRTMYQKWAGIKVHHVKSNKDFFTSRRLEDDMRLFASVDGVAWSIHNGIFYPRESAFCASCDLVNFCRGWPARES